MRCASPRSSGPIPAQRAAVFEVLISEKAKSVALLSLAVTAALSLWFVSAAILPEMREEAGVSEARLALLSTGVQAGFVVGALAFGVSGLADRFDPRRIFCVCVALGAAANASLLLLPIAGPAAIAARVVTGAAMAGVYPIGMKIAVGWGLKDRGLMVGFLVGAVTMGSATPYLIAFLGGADWRATVGAASLVALAAAALVLRVRLGPHHAVSQRFDIAAVRTAVSDRRIRLACAGYFGHMWELYAMWSWSAAALAAAFVVGGVEGRAEDWARLCTFVAIALGAVASVFAGRIADRVGKAEIAMAALAVGAVSAIAAALAFGGSPWLVAAAFVCWGIAIVPDSGQFSALVADFAPPDQVGSIMTLQTALGYALSIVTVQAAPEIVAHFGWPILLLTLAVGPLLGLMAMARLRPLVNRAPRGRP